MKESSRPGSTVIVQRVRPGFEQPYREWSRRINRACSGFPGFVDLEVFEPVPGEEERFVIVVRFLTESELNAWHESAQCKELLQESKPFLEQAVMHAPSSVFGSWFRHSNGDARRPSRPWKEALTVLLVLYPTVMLLSVCVVDPFLKGWPRASSTYVANLLSVSILTWVLMPLATRALRFWLRPLPNSEGRKTLIGLMLVLACQFLSVALFQLWLGS